MPAILARLVAWFRSMPVAQQALIGIGVPAVAGAAIIANVRRGSGGEESEAVGRGGGQSLTAPTAGVEIPFGGGLDDLFGLQSALASVETDLSRRIDAIRTGRSPLPGGGSAAVPQQNEFIGRAIFSRMAPTDSPPSTRAVVKSPIVRNAEAVASIKTVSRTPSPRLATRLREQTRAPKKTTPAPRLATRLREQAPAPKKAKPVNMAGARRITARLKPRATKPQKRKAPTPRLATRLREQTQPRVVRKRSRPRVKFL